MQIGNAVTHVFYETLEGKIISKGFGIFRGMYSVLWNDGRTFHHKAKYLQEKA